MGKIERLAAVIGKAFGVPDAEAQLVGATLGLADGGFENEARLTLVLREAGFENPSDTDLAGYGNTWFR